MFGGKVTNYGGEVFGPNDFTTALTYSINTTFGKVGNLLRRKRLIASMQRFGFYQTPPLPLPAGEVVPSGRYGKKGLLSPDAFMDPLAVAWAACRPGAGPGHAAADGARRRRRGQRRPRHEAVLHPGGRRRPPGTVVQKAQPQQWMVAMKPAAAAELNTMMQRVVNAGTGTAAALAGHPGRRQDRHRRARRRHQPGLVHRLRAGRRPAGGRSPSSSRTRSRPAARRRRRSPPP